jgi:hypothetical protein
MVADSNWTGKGNAGLDLAVKNPEML